jgi:VIT1/CCC1 family predicted Fe2+/Mn2+ transporter
LDGIVSTFALVAGLGGANVPIPTLLAVGFAKVLADAFSMGFGEFTSATSELEHNMRIKLREEWETDNFKEGEVKEMCEIYIQKGVQKEDALTLMTVLSNYRDLFVEHMMVMEHGIMFSDEDAADKWAPMKQGFVCFAAFAVFGLVPLLGFMVAYAIKGGDFSVGWVLGLAYVLTAITLFIMGLTKSKLTGQENHLKSGLLMVLNGTVAGGCAYLVGEVLTAAFTA